MAKTVKKIVVTGGPCAGKSTAARYLRDYFGKRGYCVLVIHETATELINSGIAPWTLESRGDYQRVQLKMQLEKEKVFDTAALKIKDYDKVLIVCDRGIMDSRAYMGDSAFAGAIDDLHMTESDVLKRYDAVFHLKSTANGAEKFYTLDNNSARIETVEEASVLDGEFTRVWGRHPYFKVVECTQDVEEKMKCLIDEIRVFLEKL